MAHTLHWPLLAAGLTLVTAGLAQSVTTAGAPYPNTEQFGTPVARDAPWFQACLWVDSGRPPAASPALPASCQSFDYYDKLAQTSTSDAEWAGVRACALTAQDNAVLAMLYANGLGVPRDLDLATLYVCRAGGAPAELRGRVEHVQALKTAGSGQRFDQCDDATSGYMMGVCSSIADGQAEKVRHAYLVRLRQQLPAQQVQAFDALLAATRALAQARGKETDMSGTGRAAFAIQAEAGEKEWLREHLAAFEKGHAALPPAQQFAGADAALNRAYQALMGAATDRDAPDRLPGSTVTNTDVRAAQRAWLAARDAWVRFAALRYPAIAPDSLKAAFTDWRSKQLRRMR